MLSGVIFGSELVFYRIGLDNMWFVRPVGIEVHVSTLNVYVIVKFYIIFLR